MNTVAFILCMFKLNMFMAKLHIKDVYNILYVASLY